MPLWTPHRHAPKRCGAWSNRLFERYTKRLGELAPRDAGGPRDDLGDVGRGDLGHPGRRAGQLVELLADLADLVPQLGGVLVLLAGDGLVLVPLQLLGAALQIRKDILWFHSSFQRSAVSFQRMLWADGH